MSKDMLENNSIIELIESNRTITCRQIRLIEFQNFNQNCEYSINFDYLRLNSITFDYIRLVRFEELHSITFDYIHWSQNKWIAHVQWKSEAEIFRDFSQLVYHYWDHFILLQRWFFCYSGHHSRARVSVRECKIRHYWDHFLTKFGFKNSEITRLVARSIYFEISDYIGLVRGITFDYLRLHSISSMNYFDYLRLDSIGLLS